jgi:iron complex outermembrane receptor protein
MRTSSVLSLASLPLALAVSGVLSAAQIEEIVVTAQRRAENVQDVPISVSAMSADTLEALGAVDVSTSPLRLQVFTSGASSDRH